MLQRFSLYSDTHTRNKRGVVVKSQVTGQEHREELLVFLFCNTEKMLPTEKTSFLFDKSPWLGTELSMVIIYSFC